MITVESPIVGKGGTVTEAMAFLDGPDDQDVAYVNELFRLCNLATIDGRVAFGQFCVETANGTSARWLTNRNPAGLGIAADTDADPAKLTGAEAARVHVWALHFASESNENWEWSLPDSVSEFRSRWVRKFGLSENNAPIVRTVADLCRHYTDAHGEQQATWAWDETYADQICAKANRIFANSGNQNQEESMAVYPVAGLPGPGIELPVPLIQRLLPISEFNRPGRKRQLPGFWVQHETDNYSPGADALMHANWLQGGPTDSEGNRQYVGFHFCVDDHQVTQMIPIDEIGWHAADGAGPGNYSGIGCELCVNRGIDTAKARHNAEALAGGIMRALAMGADRCKRHWDFNAGTADRHHCPDTMMNDGYWPTFAANVGKIISAKPDQPPAMPTVPWDRDATGPHKIGKTACLAYLGMGTAAREVPVTDHIGKGAKTIYTIGKGEPVLIRGGTRPNGVGYVFVEIAGKGVGRARWSAFRERWPLP